MEFEIRRIPDFLYFINSNITLIVPDLVSRGLAIYSSPIFKSNTSKRVERKNESSIFYVIDK